MTPPNELLATGFLLAVCQLRAMWDRKLSLNLGESKIMLMGAGVEERGTEDDSANRQSNDDFLFTSYNYDMLALQLPCCGTGFVLRMALYDGREQPTTSTATQRLFVACFEHLSRYVF